MHIPLILLIVITLSACGGINPKVYPSIDIVKPSIVVRTQWVAKVGEAAEDHYKQLPAVFVNDQIYVANKTGIEVLDVNSGKRQWKIDVIEKFTAGPAVGQNFMVLANENAEVVAFNIESKREMWRTRVSSIVLANPLVVKDRVVVQTVNGKVVALDLKTGKQLWVESREEPALTLRGTGQPIVVGDNIVTGFSDGKVLAVELASGKNLWEASIAVPRGRSDLERVVDVDGVLYFDGNLIYAVAYQGRVAALSAQTGQIVWMREMSSYTGVIVNENQIFLSDAEGTVWSLDTKTGATIWSQNKLEGRDLSMPAVMGQTVIVGDGAGYLHWFAKEDGKLLAQQNLNEVYRNVHGLFGDEDISDRRPSVTTEPEVFNQQVYVRDNAGALSAFKVLPKELL